MTRDEAPMQYVWSQFNKVLVENQTVEFMPESTHSQSSEDLIENDIKCGVCNDDVVGEIELTRCGGCLKHVCIPCIDMPCYGCGTELCESYKLSHTCNKNQKRKVYYKTDELDDSMCTSGWKKS